MVDVVLNFAHRGWREQVQREELSGAVVTINGLKQARKQGMVDSRSPMYFAGKLTR